MKSSNPLPLMLLLLVSMSALQSASAQVPDVGIRRRIWPDLFRIDYREPNHHLPGKYFKSHGMELYTLFSAHDDGYFFSQQPAIYAAGQSECQWGRCFLWSDQ
jgi:hypothetical protein